MPTRRPLLLALAGALLTASTFGLAYATPRNHTVQLLTLFALATAAYAALLHSRLPLRAGLLLALGLHLLWLPVTPPFSDDYHRFRWDGILVAAGQNPYLHRPSEFAAAGGSVVGPAALTTALFARLNSPGYYSVYPPVCQAVFGAAAGLFPRSEMGQIMSMRVVLLLAETATAALLVLLLRRWRLPAERALWYLLHPLVVVELVGNLHFEALVITGLLLTLWLLTRQRPWLAGVALAAAVATKLTPLLALPLLVRRLGWSRTFRFGFVVLMVLVLLFAPFTSAGLLRNLGRSLDLYFHSFEFNASVYYVLRAVGFWLTGYNEIARLGTALALTAALSILTLAALEKHPTIASLPRALLLALTQYYALATTVHPWYLTVLVALSCFTGWRYPATWAALATLSYATYRTSAYQEDLRLVALEYLGVLLAAALDWHRNRSAPDDIHIA